MDDTALFSAFPVRYVSRQWDRESWAAYNMGKIASKAIRNGLCFSAEQKLSITTGMSLHTSQRWVTGFSFLQTRLTTVHRPLIPRVNRGVNKIISVFSVLRMGCSLSLVISTTVKAFCKYSMALMSKCQHKNEKKKSP